MATPTDAATPTSTATSEIPTVPSTAARALSQRALLCKRKPPPPHISAAKGALFSFQARLLAQATNSNLTTGTSIVSTGSNFSRSQYARGGLLDRAITTLKADHSPRLARWTVVQREQL